MMVNFAMIETIYCKKEMEDSFKRFLVDFVSYRYHLLPIEIHNSFLLLNGDPCTHAFRGWTHTSSPRSSKLQRPINVKSTIPIFWARVKTSLSLPVFNFGARVFLLTWIREIRGTFTNPGPNTQNYPFPYMGPSSSIGGPPPHKWWGLIFD